MYCNKSLGWHCSLGICSEFCASLDPWRPGSHMSFLGAIKLNFNYAPSLITFLQAASFTSKTGRLRSPESTLGTRSGNTSNGKSSNLFSRKTEWRNPFCILVLRSLNRYPCPQILYGVHKLCHCFSLIKGISGVGHPRCLSSWSHLSHTPTPCALCHEWHSCTSLYQESSQKSFAPLVGLLRSQGIQVMGYLDDLPLKDNSTIILCSNIQKVIHFL